jgi:hypothetical protein
MEKRTRTRRALPVGVAIGVAVVSIFFLIAVSAHALYEGVAFRVSTFGGVSPHCEGGNISDNSNYTDAFVHVATDHWLYDVIHSTFVDTAVDPEDLTDLDRSHADLTGDDLDTSNGSDWADTVYLTTHAKTQCMEYETPYSGGTWQCCGDDTDEPPDDCEPSSTSYDCANHGYSRITMGDSSSHCYIYADEHGSDPGNIYFGNTNADGAGDMNIFVTTACNSLTPCVRKYGGYNDMDYGDFHTYLGQYGTHTYETGEKAAFENFLMDAIDDHVGSEWLTHQHYEAKDVDDAYTCPMVLIWGSSSSNCDYMYNYGGFTDFKDTGTHTINKMYWVGGCDPDEVGYDRPTFDHPALPDL